ncbi:hypothetical protein AWH69_05135 [Janibacter melonis]|uniref:LytR/CpsA/Psr regulator C-terminal domain-containing protein n=1 Tax=Janibacter melonis TaxID=262209 RepID=A0A176QCI7_9MICO|nr:LytR C-terminal domain-containing protein [Janibacter melonis]OAB87469.1 hypothetical protein AWH69_05135 [Janibacter melonis]
MARGDYEEVDRGRSQGRRTFVTVLVVLLLLFFAFWYAMSYIRADEARREPRASASTSSACPVQPEDVVVNVYNGTGRDGLAASVARDLRKRGFEVRTIDNWRGGQRVDGAGQIRYGKRGAPKVALLAKHTGSMKKVVDKRRYSIIDVVIGKDFADLQPVSRARRC